MTQIRHSYPVDTKLLRTNPKYMFNPCIDALAPAASIQLAEKAKTLSAAGQTIFDLTIGRTGFRHAGIHQGGGDTRNCQEQYPLR